MAARWTTRHACRTCAAWSDCRVRAWYISFRCAAGPPPPVPQPPVPPPPPPSCTAPVAYSHAAPHSSLQGLVTNDVLPLEAPGALPMYACILNAQGRYLHDLFLHRTLGGWPSLDEWMVVWAGGCVCE